eukprot:TRINITY_DN12709_c0_g1_i1.p1 TRINITY_DN12709_c0_g1~~TRINITY_DN12709_c0_g1_i1.p1  ORF type:complete len:181 (+),score=24.71 TRINITY_DN12709_c0_g1_i1:24-566(+)
MSDSYADEDIERAWKNYQPKEFSAGGSKFRIIAATSEHIALIVDLFDQYRQFCKQEHNLQACEDFITKRLHRKESVIFVVVEMSDEEKVLRSVGFAQLFPYFTSSMLRRVLLLNDLFIDPSFRNRGIGEKLLSVCADFSRAVGCYKLTLMTVVENVGAQKLYEKFGFKIRSEFYNYELIL